MYAEIVESVSLDAPISLTPFDPIQSQAILPVTMATESKLVRASDTTRAWLRRLREQIPQLDYTEAKYWAAFKAGTSGAVAQLNPSHGTMRLFLPLDSRSAQDLKPTPSSGTWAKRFQSVFDITSEQDLPRAGQLIVSAAATVDQRSKGTFTRRADQLSAEELEDGTLYQEGAVRQVTVNAYERNQDAREACVRHYGRSCIVCGFNFLEAYGTEAADYIQVHHTKPIARVGGTYALNPIKDLRPVCPNCHAVIHRRDPPFEIAEVKRMLRKASAQCRKP
jgi:predicted HNH restriction endonuclease